MEIVEPSAPPSRVLSPLGASLRQRLSTLIRGAWHCNRDHDHTVRVERRLDDPAGTILSSCWTRSEHCRGEQCMFSVQCCVSLTYVVLLLNCCPSTLTVQIVALVTETSPRARIDRSEFWFTIYQPHSWSPTNVRQFSLSLVHERRS